MLPDEPLPGVNFVSMLEPSKESALSFFSKEDLAALDTVGYIVRDGFLSSVEDIQRVNDEVRLSADRFSFQLIQIFYAQANGLLERGDLKLAGMSRGGNKWNNSDV